MTTHDPGRRSLRSLTTSGTQCMQRMSPLAWSLTNVDSRPLYYSDGLGGLAGNWVDGVARHWTAANRKTNFNTLPR